MTIPEAREALSTTKPEPLGWFVLLPLVVGAFGYFLLGRVFLNHDVAWVLYGSQQLLAGAQFGVDIVAANPPLIWWINLLPTTLAGFFGISPVLSLRLFVFASIGVSLWAINRLLRAGGFSALRRALFLTVATGLLTIGVFRDFGQREQFTVLFTMPYLLAASLRFDVHALSGRFGFGIGVFAGIGVALKPYFVIVPILVELALFLRRRDLRLFVRPEAIGATLALLFYLAAIFIWARPWLFDVVPAISEAYWAFNRSLEGRTEYMITRFYVPLIVGLGIYWYSQKNGLNASFMLFLLLSSVGFMCAAILQKKYYTYHLYPAVSLVVLAHLAAPTLFPAYLRRAYIVLLAILVPLSFVSAFQWFSASGPRSARHDAMTDIVDFVEDKVPAEGSYLAISTHPYPGFPISVYADREWASTRNSRLFLPAIVRLRESGAKARQEMISRFERMERDSVLEDLGREPELVLIDTRSRRHAIGSTDFDFLAFYREEPEFRTAWQAYERVPSPSPGFDAYIREAD